MQIIQQCAPIHIGESADRLVQRRNHLGRVVVGPDVIRIGGMQRGWLRLQTIQRAVAASVRRDQAAVQAALNYAWSSGPVEGQVTKIKLVKRQMYGRAKFDLLRRRLLLAG